MYILVDGQEYELNTKLITSKRVEKKFNVPLGQLFSQLQNATVEELIKILAIAADKERDDSFRTAIESSWDYADIFLAVQELVARLTFSGDAESIEKKMQRYNLSEEQKNVFRGLLGIPIPEPPADLASVN